MFWAYFASAIALTLCAITLVLAAYALYLVYLNHELKKDYFGRATRIRDDVWEMVRHMNPTEEEIEQIIQKFNLTKRYRDPVILRTNAAKLWRLNKASALRAKRHFDNDLSLL